MFELLNWYSASFSLIILGVIEMMVVMYVYGCEKYLSNLEEMGVNIPCLLKYYWITTWKFITPLALCFVFFMSCYQYSPAYAPSYSQEHYVFPTSIQVLGWVLVLTPLFLIIICGAYQMVTAKQEGLKAKLLYLVTPTENWKPACTGTKKEGIPNQNFSADNI